MKVHHLNTGTLCPVGARFVNGTGAWFGRSRLVCHVLLVESSAGLVLVDGGIGTGDVANPDRLGRSWVRRVSPRLDPSETALAQVQALGFAPSEVRHLVVTHLDLDHAGAIPDFPHATVHVHAREIASARASEGSQGRGRYILDQMPDPAQVRAYDGGGESWFGFDGVRALDDRDADVLLVPLHGHTHGHCGVAVREDHRWLLHAGDSYFFHGQMEAEPHIPAGLRFFQRRADTDRALRVANQEKVRQLALSPEGGVAVFSSHDPVEYDRAISDAAMPVEPHRNRRT